MACCLQVVKPLWLVAWSHQALTWTNVQISLVRFCGIHPRAISQWVLMLLFCIMSLKIIFFDYCHISQGPLGWGGFSICHVVMNNSPFLVFSQELAPNGKFNLIGQLKSHGIWFGAIGNQIQGFHPIRTQEMLIYANLLANHELQADHMAEPIFLRPWWVYQSKHRGPCWQDLQILNRIFIYSI